MIWKKDLTVLNITYYYSKGSFMEKLANKNTLYTISDRYQRALLNNTTSHNFITSKWSKIHHSVPQGTVLGPLLFLEYINDLQKIVDNTSVPILLAGDTSIIFTHHD